MCILIVIYKKQIIIMLNKNKEKFSLKDHLYNRGKVKIIAESIYKVNKAFQKEVFTEECVAGFKNRELKERMDWTTECLYKYLGDGIGIKNSTKCNVNINLYKNKMNILLASLPAPLDENKTDDDFGDYIYASYNNFVNVYGMEKKDFKYSINAIKELTKRFSCEYTIRYFINKYSKETMIELYKMSKDKNYHIRRLASEGSRPRLPWGTKVNIDIYSTEKILDCLYNDKTRYVVRSVANHLNDIAKIDKMFVINKLKGWRENKINHKINHKINTSLTPTLSKGEEVNVNQEMEYLIKHSLRNLIKDGDRDALAMININNNIKIKDFQLKILNKKVKIREGIIGKLDFNISFLPESNQDLMINYIIYFQNSSGKMNSKKIFKIKNISTKKNEKIILQKSHPFKIMTTRKLYKGEHKIVITINGKEVEEGRFELI